MVFASEIPQRPCVSTLAVVLWYWVVVETLRAKGAWSWDSSLSLTSFPQLHTLSSVPFLSLCFSAAMRWEVSSALYYGYDVLAFTTGLKASGQETMN